MTVIIKKPAQPPIIELEPEVIKLMLDNYYDGIPPERGLFLSQHGEPAVFTALDNTGGQMLMEEFGDRFTAERWLREDR